MARTGVGAGGGGGSREHAAGQTKLLAGFQAMEAGAAQKRELIAISPIEGCRAVAHRRTRRHRGGGSGSAGLKV